LGEVFRARSMSGLDAAAVRLAAVLGDDFSSWLLKKMNKKWANHSQTPIFYRTFKSMVQDLHSMDYRMRSSRGSQQSHESNCLGKRKST
jgi:hypothetical protein